LKCLGIMVSRAGLEPATTALKVRTSEPNGVACAQGRKIRSADQCTENHHMPRFGERRGASQRESARPPARGSACGWRDPYRYPPGSNRRPADYELLVCESNASGRVRGLVFCSDRCSNESTVYERFRQRGYTNRLHARGRCSEARPIRKAPAARLGLRAARAVKRARSEHTSLAGCGEDNW
jgi:hypothetical protein